MEKELLDRIRTSDPSLTKLHLVLEPSAYFDFHHDGRDNDKALEAFLQLLRNNTSITYVLLERRLARSLSKANYRKLLQAILEIPHLHQVEIWSQRVPWPALWTALQAAKELRKLGLGMVTLTDVMPVLVEEEKEESFLCKPHPTLETFYLSDFRLLPQVSETQEDGNTSKAQPNLDPVLQVLGQCPNLTQVEIFSFPEERPCLSTIWPLFRATPHLTNVTLRRLHLPSSAVDSADTMPIASPLRVLDMGENPLEDHGCASLLRRLSHTDSLWRTTLREVNLKNTSCTTELSAVLWETLSTDDATRESFSPLALEKLNLASNKLRDQGAQVLARLLTQPTCQLQHLELARCHMTNVGATALAHAMTQNNSLRVLGLAHNQIDNQAYVSFGQALARGNKTLQSINLQVDRKLIQTSGCLALQEMCRENTTLRNVSTLLNTVVANAHGEYGNRIRMYLRLNQAGRVNVANNTATLADWVQLLATVQDDLFAIHFLVRTYPHYAALMAQRLHLNQQ